MSSTRDAIVVGAGPNGLSAALAREERSDVLVVESSPVAGGGLRSDELTRLNASAQCFSAVIARRPLAQRT